MTRSFRLHEFVPGAFEETSDERRYDIAAHKGEYQMVQANRTCGVHVLPGQGTALARNVGSSMVPPLICSARDRRRGNRGLN